MWSKGRRRGYCNPQWPILGQLARGRVASIHWFVKWVPGWEPKGILEVPSFSFSLLGRLWIPLPGSDDPAAAIPPTLVVPGLKACLKALGTNGQKLLASLPQQFPLSRSRPGRAFAEASWFRSEYFRRSLRPAHRGVRGTEARRISPASPPIFYRFPRRAANLNGTPPLGKGTMLSDFFLPSGPC